MKLDYPIRINRYLALNNYATRTGADELIKKGSVTINGRKAVLGDQVNEGDHVVVSGKNLNKDYVYYAYNKAIGISTNPDAGSKPARHASQGNAGGDILKVTKFPVRVFPVGRLDKDSHGLILMTNDGRVTDRLLSPKYVHEKEYIVKVDPAFNDNFIEKMGNGVKFDGFVSKKCKCWRKNGNTFHIILTEGKKRQIRRMSEALHHEVVDLRRVRIMNIELGKLPFGEFRAIEGKEKDELLKSLKLI